MQLDVRIRDRGIGLRLQTFARRWPRVAREWADLTSRLALERAREYSSRACHSLRDLRRMGHPYARRWQGQVRVEVLALRSGGRLSVALRALAQGRYGRALSEATRVRGVRRQRTVSRRRLEGGPRLPHPAYIIHRQSGRYYRAWRRAIRVSGNRVTGVVYNNVRSARGAPYAIYLEAGTQTMIPRPLMRRVASEVAGESRRLYRRAYYRVIGR